MTFQFKIQIQGITKPPVWRTVSVPADFTFLKFHYVIQIAFGWEDSHLYEFKDKEYQGTIRISSPAEDDFFDQDFFAGIQDASKVKLSDIFTDKVRKLVYIYDFGDNWVHKISLDAILDETQKNAVCLSGKGACPPEDCGSVYGYENIKNIFTAKPDSEEAEEYRRWLGLDNSEIWDAAKFDIEEVNTYLKQI